MNAKLRPVQRANMDETEYFTQEEKEFSEEYHKSLCDLTINSKPLINMLTMLAEENSAYSKRITNIIESYLRKVSGEVKLPVLYLIDSIVKNIGNNYIPLFAENIVETFSSVFREVNEKTRMQMYKLRQTWYNVFPNDKLYALDKAIKGIDPEWPITAAPPAPPPVLQPVTQPPITQPAMTQPAIPQPPIPQPPIPKTIHVNPKFLKKQQQQQKARESVVPEAVPVEKTLSEAEMREELLRKKEGLRKLELEKKKLEEMMNKQRSRAEEKLEDLKSQISAVAKQQKKIEKVAKKTAPSKEPSRPVMVDTSVAEEPLPPPIVRRMGPPADPAMPAPTRIAPVNSALVNAVLSRDPRLAGRQGSPPAVVSVEQASEDRPVIKTSVKDPRVMKAESDSSERTKKSESPKKKSNNSPRLSRSSPEPERRSSRTGDRGKKSPRKSGEHGHSKRRSPNDSPREKKKERSSYNSSRSKEKAAIVHHDEGSDACDTNDVKHKAPSPPPPPVISDKGKSDWAVSYTKGSQKGRNYMRRNREDSPDVVTTCPMTAPPEKQPRLAEKKSDDASAEPDKTAAPIVPTTGKCVGLTSGVVALATSSTEPLKASCQDVDLRMVTSPNKKRASAEPEDVVEPPAKKSKAAVMDLLFGDEDVDLRTLPIPMKPTVAGVPVPVPVVHVPVAVPVVPVPVLTANKAPPSPPPPPKISHEARDSPSPPLKVSHEASGTPSPPHRSPRERDCVENQPPYGWAKYKQTRSPMTPHGYVRQRDHHGPPDSERSPLYARSPRQNVDRLGRPLLFHRLSEDGSDKSHPLSNTVVLPGEDTDMRQTMRFVNDAKIHEVYTHASEQVESGVISSEQYNKIVRELLCLHEKQKIQEVLDHPYNRRPDWERRPVRGRDYRHGLGSPVSKDQFGDIDERYPNPSEKRGPLLTLPTRTWNMGPDERGRDYDRSIRPHGMSGPGGSGGPPYMGLMPPRPIRPGMRRMGMRPQSGPSWGAGPPSGRNMSWKGFGSGQAGMPAPSRSDCNTFPPASEQVLQMIANDTMEETTIDHCKIRIRFYGKEAVALMGADNPQEVRFRDGERDVIIHGVAVTCAFNHPPREVNLNGRIIRVCLGAPTRELYINQNWYACNFGGPPIDIELEPGWKTQVSLQGPLPGLQFVRKRTDLIAGIVGLFIDGYKSIELYLDAKPQRFDIDGVPFVIRFTDALRVITINDEPVNLHFDGPPLRIMVNYKEHFIRLVGLPPGVRPGEVYINSMPGKSGLLPPPVPSAPGSGSLLSEADSSTRSVPVAPVAPAVPAAPTAPAAPAAPATPAAPAATQPPASRPATAQPDEPAPDDIEHNPALPMRRTRKIKPTKPDTTKSVLSQASVLPSVLSSLIAPSVSGNTAVNSYQITDTLTSSAVTSSSEVPASTSTSNVGIPFLGGDFNVDDLYQRLVASGFLKSTLSSSTETIKEDTTKDVKNVFFDKPETFKVEQPAIVSMLYSGIQCSSCGVRFPPEQTVKYSQHLDWHFRQNRRDKDSQRKPQSRKWYYDVSDWIQFEEIEDLEERAQSWFETQQNEANRPEEMEPEEMESVPAGDSPEGAFCELCHDKFEQFYNEEKEEWHLRHAIHVEDKLYHPVCYKDYKAALEEKDENEGEGEQDNEDANATEVCPEETNGDEELKEGENGDEKKEEEEETVKIEIKAEPKDEGENVASEMEEEMENGAPVKTETLEEAEPATSPSQPTDVEMTEVAEVKTEVGDTEMKEEQPEYAEGKEEGGEEKMFDEELSQGPAADTTHVNVASNIDGNVEHEDAPQSAVVAPPKIKINISKAIIPTPVEDEEPKNTPPEEEPRSEDETLPLMPPPCRELDVSSQPPPPGEEPILLKPKLMGRKLVEVPPLSRGAELSGLCSIM